MSTAALAIVLVSSLGWAAFDVMRKRLTAHLRPTPLAALLALGMLPPFVAWLALSGGVHVDPRYVVPATVAVVLNVGANLLFLRAVQIAPLSTTIPMLAFTPALAALFSALVLGEVPGPGPSLGIALVPAGALVLHGRGDARGTEDRADGPLAAGAGEPPRRFLLDHGPRLMLAVAFLWSLTSVVDKAALAYASAALHGALQCAGVGGAVLVLLLARGRAAELGSVRAAPLMFTAAVAVSAAALALQFVAFRLTYVSSVEAVKRTFGMIASVMSGRVFFGEPFTARKWAGVAAMSLGVVLILG